MDTPRKLAAILAADIAGYSRLMGLDEAGTAKALREHRAAIDPILAGHGGRVFKTTGDGVLVEFSSIVAAVESALAVQKLMAERNADVPEDRRMYFRIGINLGDVLIEGDDVLGDGVNVAARLEGLAEPGSICISDDGYRQVQGKLDVAFEDAGEQQLKNIARPVRVYRVQVDATAKLRPTLPLPSKPSIAVLAFQNMSGDPEQEYFADGIAEDIITALSRLRQLFVIARNSSFIYKGRPVDVKQVGRELGVQYVLEGSVRRAASRLRITGQLIDATQGAHLWADRFEGDLEDVFHLQDRIVASVVAAIEPMLQLAEIERLKQKGDANLNAYELLLRAQQYTYQFTEESLTAALQLLQQSLVIDPNYAPAMALAAYCYAERRHQGWAGHSDTEDSEGLRLAARATELGWDNSTVLWMAAYTTWRLAGDAHRANELADRSLFLNPNSAVALAIKGWIEALSGTPARGLELLRRAARLNPCDPRGWFTATGIGMAHFFEGQFNDAAVWTERALIQNPRYTPALRFRAASLAKLNQRDRARELIEKLLAIEPNLTISSLRRRVNVMNELYAEALRIAGLPE